MCVGLSYTMEQSAEVPEGSLPHPSLFLGSLPCYRDLWLYLRGSHHGTSSQLLAGQHKAHLPTVTPSISDKASCSAVLLAGAGSPSLSLFPQSCAPHFQGCARLVPGAHTWHCLHGDLCPLLLPNPPGTHQPLPSLENSSHDCKSSLGVGREPGADVHCVQ